MAQTADLVFRVRGDGWAGSNRANVCSAAAAGAAATAMLRDRAMLEEAACPFFWRGCDFTSIVSFRLPAVGRARPFPAVAPYVRQTGRCTPPLAMASIGWGAAALLLALSPACFNQVSPRPTMGSEFFARAFGVSLVMIVFPPGTAIMSNSRP